MKEVYRNGIIIVSKLSEEEAEEQRAIPCGIAVTKDCIRTVVEKNGIKWILEQTADGISQTKVKA